MSQTNQASSVPPFGQSLSRGVCTNKRFNTSPWVDAALPPTVPKVDQPVTHANDPSVVLQPPGWASQGLVISVLV